ncbi:MAG: ligand-binding SRPBCC domain-containing protein [Flammeovirgaceae bacterium]|jgi:ligand-binding SRPBCC domain-containing protein
MPKITIYTKINASKELAFDLSRNMDLHEISTAKTGEKAIAGVTTGLIGLNESVTWRAKHLGVWQNLTSKITEFDFPDSFIDEMQKGAFKSFRHEHLFEETDGVTLMTDIFEYKSPLGILGELADWVFLEEYMTKLLQERVLIIKDYAESGKWKEL